ncbi:hypothetical protein SAMN04487764_1826 [Gillisia sp. Hel1_33_143]|uniref:hypothetical protein n=1 Tax=unclassified Gillisia TaxID=2615025 RepID=UPI0005500A31|nr:MULTISPECIES: hypothetical protein [unclassified Gillisia]SDS26790.1 hypothetical protein SAMN04487764_1826 [Gillisia sp. Hel1_33_143]
MKPYCYIYPLLFIFFIFSCKEQEKGNGRSDLKKEEAKITNDKILLVYNRSSIPEDSLKIELIYNSSLDTLKLSEKDKRYTFLYYTFENINLEDLEKSIKEDDWSQINKNHIQSYVLDTAMTAEIYYKPKTKYVNVIKGVIDDIIFLQEYNEKGETRMIHHITKFEENIDDY